MNSDPQSAARTLIRRFPALFAMELLWRWSFGLGMIGLALYAYARLHPAIVSAAADAPALRVSGAEKQARVLVEMLAPLLPLILKLMAQLYAAGGLLWAAISAAGRAVILRSLAAAEDGGHGVSIATPGRSWASLFVLHAARVLMLLILLIGYLGGILLAALLTQQRPSPVLFALITGTVFFVAFWLWSYVNRVLGVAPVFAVYGGKTPLDATAEAVLFLRRRGARLRAANLAGNLAHAAAAGLFSLLGVATMAVPAPTAGLYALLLAEAVIYFALADFFHFSRLANVVAMVADEQSGVLPPRS